MFELKIKTDLSAMPKVVETNIEEVEPIISAAIARVDGLVVTDKKEDILAADADAAKLTKMATAIKRFRIDHIALWKEPMEAFENKCKGAEKRLEEAADTLRSKTNEVKDMWRNRKRDICLASWQKKLAEAFGEQEDVTNSIHQAAFFALWTNPKTKGTWVNSSVNIIDIEAAMDAEIARMKNTLAAMEENYAQSDDGTRAKARVALMENFDMNAVVKAVAAYHNECARMEAAKLKLNEARTAQAAPVPAEKPAPTPPPTPEAAPAAGEAKLETYNLAITGTRENLLALRKWGEEHGITFKNLNK